MSEKLAQAAWRLLKGGMIDSANYDHVMRTGRQLPAKIDVRDHAPGSDLIAVGPQGQVKILMLARDPEAGLNAARNTFGPEVTAQMNKWATAYDKEDDSAMGTKMVASFGAAASANESFLRSKGYDLDNMNDGFLLWQRFIDTAMLKRAVDDEWLLDGKFVDFTDTYGSIFQAMFDPRLDDIDRSELEIPGSTTFGMGGESPQLQPLKQRNPAEINAIMQAMPGTTPEQAEAMIAEREQAGLL